MEKEKYISNSTIKEEPSKPLKLKLSDRIKMLFVDLQNQIDSIRNGDLEDGSLSGKKIKDNTIGGRKIKDNTIGGEKIREGAIGTSKLQDESITGSNLERGSVTTEKLAPGTIDESKIILSDFNIDFDSGTGDILANFINDSDVTDADMDDNSGDVYLTLEN